MENQHKKRQVLVITFIVLGLTVLGTVLVINPFRAQANKAADQEPISADADTQNSIDRTNTLIKNETVYAKLGLDGAVKDTTVVSWLHFAGSHPTTIVDPVQLKNPQAMNGAFKVNQGTEGISIEQMDTNKNDFFYSGQTDKALPETVDIKYYWQGQEISGRELIGKSGQVKIIVNLHNQLAGGKMGDTNIYTPLVNMVALDLPIATFSNVQASDGVITTVGETMKANWMLFPYPDASAVLTAEAQDFTLSSISITVQPMMPPLPQVEIGDQLKQLDDGLNSMDNALAQMEAGSGKLASGGQQLQGGLAVMDDGTDKLVLLNQVQQKIVSAAIAIDDKIIAAVNPLAENPLLSEQTKPLLAGLKQQQQVLTTMLKGGALEGQQIPAMSTTSEKLTEMKAGMQKLAAGSAETINGANQIKSGLAQVRNQGIAPMREGLAKALSQVKFEDVVKAALQERVNNYNCFLGKPDGSQSRVQFILQTEELAK